LEGRVFLLKNPDACVGWVNYDAGALSIGVYVTIKDGYATVVSNNYY
jgi:hypothetical protein